MWPAGLTIQNGAISTSTYQVFDDSSVSQGIFVDLADAIAALEDNYTLTVLLPATAGDVGTFFISQSGVTINADAPFVGTVVATGTELTLLGDATITVVASGASARLFGNDGDNALFGTAGDDTLQAYEGNDVLLGFGGNDVLRSGLSGDKTMSGGEGDDTYVALLGTEEIFENVFEGTDTVFTATSFELRAGQEIENLFAGNGAGAIKLEGNEFGQRIRGNDGANETIVGGDGADTMEGRGGNDLLISTGGLDVMNGGEGNDVYVIKGNNNVFDIIEGTGKGFDVLKTSVNFSLTSNAEIEVLEVRGSTGVFLSGNDRDQRVLGNSGDDTLVGGGGEDILIGRDGADVFLFDAFSGDDTITDFVENEDLIDMVFAGVNDFSELTLTQIGSGVVVGYADQTLTLNDIQVADLDADDFNLLDDLLPPVAF